ncbi:hypothetical protein llg_33890 [Luteolibacter sp. LG18]|nr:hypothetical protein llg_33890 [Luteolibacter sp. LG18]
MSLFVSVLIFSSCAGKSERELWNTLPGKNPVPVLIKTSGKLTFQKSKDSVVATIVCPNWPWFEMTVIWPAGNPRIGQADMVVMEEKWLGGGREVVRVFSSGKTIYDASICEKHQIPMARVEVENFDVGSNPARYQVASQKAFPNDGKDYYLSGYGCGSGLTKRVWRCPSCYEASKRWME